MKRKETSHTFEYEIEEKPGLTLTDLDESKWLNTRAYIEPAPTPRGEVGWICPVCGRGLAPSMSWCPCNVSTSTSVSATFVTPAIHTMTLDGTEEYDWVMTMPVDDTSRSVD